jgi:riboflavin kinase/FMN adenylyltransferase
MEVYNNLNSLPKFKNAVVTIGSFDGVHSGHQTILKRVRELAQSIDGQSVVVTFTPHPRLVLNPSEPPSVSLLTTDDEKAFLLKEYGVDVVVIVPFTLEFANQTPDDYIQNFLVQYFQPRYLVIGYDHRFGANRAGDLALLKKYAHQFKYEVVEIDKHIVQNLEVSSTKIRQAIEKAEIRNASRLLGHPYIFSGKVVEGQHIGREIGFPTANLQIPNGHKLVPPHGIYAVYVYLGDRKLKGMMYRGDRPVLKDHHNVTIEINIFDFKEDIYGREMTVELIEFLRPDRYFDSLESLIVQLADDERESRDILQLYENKKNPKVAIVILNYNTPQFLKQFLPAICGSRYGNMEVFVADNGSTDNSVEAVRQVNLEGAPAAQGVDRVRLIQLDKNYGFAKGYNEALKHEKVHPRTPQYPDGFDYYVLLNSDCRTSQGWLTPIILMMEADRSIAVAQPKILSYAKKRRFEYAGAAGGWIDALGYPFSKGRVFDSIEKDKKQYDEPVEIFWASGAAMVVRADVWHKFEGFDADYWAHMEEIDFCWRVKRAGYKVMSQPKGVARHVGGGTLDYLSPRKTYLNFRNSLFTIVKNDPLSKLLWLLPVRFVLDGVAGVRFLTQGNWRHCWQIVRAHFSFYGSIFSVLKKRAHYTQLIDNQRIAPPNLTAVLRGSVIWQYYVNKKRTFAELMGKPRDPNATDDDDDD